MTPDNQDNFPAEQSPEAKEAEAKLYRESEERRKEKAKAEPETFESATTLKKGQQFVIRNKKILKITKTESGSYSSYVGKESDPAMAILMKKHKIKHG